MSTPLTPRTDESAARHGLDELNDAAREKAHELDSKYQGIKVHREDLLYLAFIAGAQYATRIAIEMQEGNPNVPLSN